MNATIEKLQRIEERARLLARQRWANEANWEKAFELARKTPEWKAYCKSKGIVEKYDYNDVIC